MWYTVVCACYLFFKDINDSVKKKNNNCKTTAANKVKQAL